MLGLSPPHHTPEGWREPAEQDATRYGLLVQRQAETNNAAPCFGRYYPFRSVRLFMLSVGVHNECGHTNVPISLVLRNSQTRMPALATCWEVKIFGRNKCSSDVDAELE